MDLQQAYDRINREALWSGRLLNVIRNMYVDSEACVRLNRVESEWFKIEI